MDGFRLVKLNEVIRQVDIVITCTGMIVTQTVGWHLGTLGMEQVKNDWKCSKQNQTLKARDSSPQNQSFLFFPPL